MSDGRSPSKRAETVKPPPPGARRPGIVAHTSQPTTCTPVATAPGRCAWERPRGDVTHEPRSSVLSVTQCQSHESGSLQLRVISTAPPARAPLTPPPHAPPALRAGSAASRVRV